MKDVLTQAAEMRAEHIEQLKICDCRWPIVKLRNGSGHSSSCPAHAAWEQTMAARRDR